MKTQINGANYHYEMSGDGDDCVLLLHGFAGTGRTWVPLMAAFNDTLRLFAPDIIGHGGTDSPPDFERYRMQAVTADLAALLDHIGVDRVHLVGYSMGGRLALYMAIRHPERIKTLALVSASPGLRTSVERAARRRHDAALAERIERDGIDTFVAYWESLSLWDTQSAALKSALRSERMLQNPAGLANSLRGMGTGAQPSLWDNLPTITAPVALIVGEHDSKFVAVNEAMGALIPKATLAIVPEAGHAVHLENPVALRTIFRRFW